MTVWVVVVQGMAPPKEIDRLKVLLKIEVEKQNRSFGIINAMRAAALDVGLIGALKNVCL